jgi:5'-3' exonuclease
VLLLLDAPSMYFRAYYAVPGTAPDGSPIGAVRGFLDALARLLRSYQPALPERIVACLDLDWRPAFRVAALPSYKAHRVAADGRAENVPADLEVQVPVLVSVLEAAGLAVAGATGYEADDVIGTLVARDSGPVDILTGDRDLFQLVRDDRPVRVLFSGRGGPTVVDEAEITRRYGIPGRAYLDFATLRGDPSDGLPGVPGIGEKTAAAIIARFGSLAAARAKAGSGADDGFPAGARRRLAAAEDYLERVRTVVMVAADAPLPKLVDKRPVAPADPAALATLAQRYGLDGPVRRLAAALRWAGFS